MGFEDLIREGEKRRAEDQRRRAKTIHDGSTEHVRAGVNELHHLVRLAITPELLEACDHGHLEHELLEAINRARSKANEHTGTDPLRRATELFLNSG